ncbi:MAG: methylenetetrahydrofolate reductase [Pseudomonadota bacterium]
MSSQMAARLEQGEFLVTSELTPPKGTNLEPLFQKADMLARRVDAFNVTDCHGARVAMSSMAVSKLLADRGIEPIMQMTARDRNRIGMQADMLGAHALGIRNIVFMGGDKPTTGDHPDAAGVYDLQSHEMLAAARGLNSGSDFAGNALKGNTEFLVGAVANPGADDIEAELAKLGDKLEGGARFFQTQAVYEPESFMRFNERASEMGAYLLAGIIPLKSPKMARFLHDKVPGISVPDHLMKRVDDASDSTVTAIEIAAETIRALKSISSGVHVMAIGWEDHVPAILEAAEIEVRREAA